MVGCSCSIAVLRLIDLLNPPFATHRDLSLLLAGIALGLLLGPAVLGKVAPQTYQRWFVGGDEAKAALDAFDAETEQMRHQLAQTGVTPAAIDEFVAQRKRESLPQLAGYELQRTEHEKWLSSRMLGLMLAAILIMILEALYAPRPRADGSAQVPVALGRLITIRYALIAVWIVLALAAPAMLYQTPLLFIALALAVALLVGFMPLGKKM